MDLSTLTFIDVETTGLSPGRDRIIEIGVLRMHNGKIVKTFETLINPDCYLPPEITLLTGITGNELERAPLFSRIADDIQELLDDSIFVAHNARFDYSFIKSEFERLERSFSSQVLCTAKLSRKLFPRFKRHNLDSIIDRFGITCDMRHRAFSDAQVLYQFYKKAKKQFGMDVLTEAVMHVTKTAALPTSISRETVKKLPESPGVYVFYGKNGTPLYIGKSINLKDRILSHFYDFANSNKEARIFQTIESIETIPTSGELGALLLESQMIKKMQPLYNRKLRRAATLLVLLQTTTPNGYYTVQPVETSDIDIEKLERVVAVFRTRSQMKQSLIDLSREYQLCQKLLGLEKGKGKCFGSQIHTCHGACVGDELPARYNMRFTEAFYRTRVREWPFSGAIAIREGKTTHLVYRWCYIGEGHDIESIDPQSLNRAAVFDYDAYRILSSHILRKVSDQDIQEIKTF